MEYYHISHKGWGKLVTYMGKHAKTKIMVDFPRGNKKASKKAVVVNRKVARTRTLSTDVSQSRSCNKLDML